MLVVGLAALALAGRVLRAGGLHGGGYARDPQGGDAVVLAQEPPAGTLVPPGGMVGFRTMTGVQPYGASRRLKGCGRPPPAGLTGWLRGHSLMLLAERRGEPARGWPWLSGARWGEAAGS
jgi:hypothetical protein